MGILLGSVAMDGKYTTSVIPTSNWETLLLLSLLVRIGSMLLMPSLRLRY